MTMIPNLQDIQQYLEDQLKVSGISISDDSHLHHSHTNFQATKAYLTITIPNISGIPRLQLHRKIMQYAKEVCNQPIHAIAINIQK